MKNERRESEMIRLKASDQKETRTAAARPSPRGPDTKCGKDKRPPIPPTKGYDAGPQAPVVLLSLTTPAADPIGT
jgi:hypothetical protein